jgi:hypothetical protein
MGSLISLAIVMAAEARAAARRLKRSSSTTHLFPGEEKLVPFQFGDELVFGEGPHRILR